MNTMTVEERNEIIMGYMPTLKKIAYKYYNKINSANNKDLINYIEAEDMINMGVFGVLRAINKYKKSEVKIPFALFAYKYVIGSIINGTNKAMNINNYRKEVYRRIEKTIIKEQQNKGRLISYHELAEAMGIDNEKLNKILSGIVHRWDTLLYRGFDYDREIGAYNIENKADQHKPDALETIEARLIIKQLIEELNKKQRVVIKMRFYRKKKLCDIAVRLKHSNQLIQSTCKAALRKLKIGLEEIKDVIDIKGIITE